MQEKSPGKPGLFSALLGQDLYPVAVRVLDEVDAHLLVDEADDAQLLVLFARGLVVVHTQGEVDLALAEVVGLLMVAQPGEFELEARFPVAEEDQLVGAVRRRLSRTGLRPRASS